MKRSPIPEPRTQVLLRRVMELYAQNLANEPEPKRWLAAHGLIDQRLWAEAFAWSSALPRKAETFRCRCTGRESGNAGCGNQIGEKCFISRIRKGA